ncbi:imidazole glycerol phosphate synthase subunit HisH [Candidatus Vidania fulgoroideorum]
MKIGIIDIEYGNIFSLYKSIKSINEKNKIVIIKDIEKINTMDRIIFPGNGSIKNCFNSLKKIDFLLKLKEYIKRIPFLGICLGKQILFNFNNEGNINGIGIFNGEIKKIISFKKPHIGWNKIKTYKKYKKHKLIKNASDNYNNNYFFFSHSYYVKTKSNNICSYTKYEKKKIPAIYIKDNINLLQFHPEKSSYNGLRILNNFLEKC